MAIRDQRDRNTNRRSTSTFMMIPTAVLKSSKFVGLSLKARALLWNIGAEYTGYNNGHLAATWPRMERRNWKSKQTLQNATEELVAVGMIDCNRHGFRGTPILFGFTWVAIHEGKNILEVRSGGAPSGRWKDELPPIPWPIAPTGLARLSGQPRPIAGVANSRKGVPKTTITPTIDPKMPLLADRLPRQSGASKNMPSVQHGSSVVPEASALHSLASA